MNNLLEKILHISIKFTPMNLSSLLRSVVNFCTLYLFRVSIRCLMKRKEQRETENSTILEKKTKLPIVEKANSVNLWPVYVIFY